MTDLHYRLYWHEDLPNVIVFHFEEGMTWQNFERAGEEAKTMIQSVADRVDIVSAPQTNMPAGNPFPYLRSTVSSLFAYSNVHMLVRTGPIITGTHKETFDILAKALRFDPKKLVVAASIDDAIELIRRDREQTN